MIWPGRPLARLLILPAVIALALFVIDAARPVLIGVDVVIALVALADLLTLRGTRNFRAQRVVGVTASIGEPQRVELWVDNLGRGALVLRIRDDIPENFTAEPDEFEVRAPGRSRVELIYNLTPRCRGTYRMRRVYALVSSRLGFWRRNVSWPAESVLRVYPDLRQIERYAVLARRNRLSALGVRRTRLVGADNEFERLRDYAEGDEPRHIDWRASARRSKLTVRAHQINQSQRIIFMIDCGRMMAGDVGDGLTPLDHAFNAMLLLAHVALIRGDEVGLIAFSDRIRAFIPPGGGARRVSRLAHAVHNIFPEIIEPRLDRAFVELEKRCRKRSLVVLMTNVFDDVEAALASDHLSNLVGRHLPLGVFLRDREIFAMADHAADNAVDFYRAAAAAAVLNWRERTLVSLRRRGVLTLDVFPDELTASVVNQYLQIKARHLL